MCVHTGVYGYHNSGSMSLERMIGDSGYRHSLIMGLI